MRYTIGIVTYERPDCLERALRSLLDQQRSPEEVIIIGDGERRPARNVVNRLSSEFKASEIPLRYRHRENGGKIQTARNEILELAVGDVICFIDDDVVCDPGWLAAIDEGYRTYDVASVGGPTIKTNGDLQPVNQPLKTESGVNVANDYGEIVDTSGRWIPPRPVKTDVFRGANMSFETSVLEEIGGFDGDYEGPEIFEEWDVMVRVRNRGESLLYHPSARVDHVEVMEGGSRSKLRDGLPGSYWYARNSVLFRKKHAEERYRRSLLRLLALGTEDNLPTILRRVAILLRRGDLQQLPWLRGYASGFKNHL